MRYTTMILLALAGFAVLLLTGCQSATEAFLGGLERAVANGELTPEAAEEAKKIWNANVETGQWWVLPLEIGIGVLLTALGIRSNLPIIGRGAPTQKVGLPASKVIPTT